MATTVVKPGTPREYVPKDERDLADSEQTVIIMKKLPAEKKAKIRDGVVGLSDDGSVNQFKNNQTALRMTLNQFNGWKNVVDADGSEITFDSSPKGKLECFNMLPDDLQDELINEFGSVGVTGEEEEEQEEDFVEDDEDDEDEEFVL